MDGISSTIGLYLFLIKQIARFSALDVFYILICTCIYFISSPLDLWLYGRWKCACYYYYLET